VLISTLPPRENFPWGAQRLPRARTRARARAAAAAAAAAAAVVVVVVAAAAAVTAASLAGLEWNSFGPGSITGRASVGAAAALLAVIV